MNDTSHERFEVLLMKAVDGVIDAQEQQQLARHLHQCASCRQELQDFKMIKETTDAMTQRMLQDAAITPPRETRPTRLVVAAGLALLLLGLLLLLVFAAKEFLLNPQTPLSLKVGASLAGVGALLLLGHFLFHRIRTWRKDPYNEVDQ